MDVFKWITGSYSAVVDKKRRRPPKLRTYHEDEHAKGRERTKLLATARDVVRNFSVARWAIGKHLDYVSSFSFQAKTGDPGLDDEIEALFRPWFGRYGCDVARRHPFRRFVRLAEARRCVDGDFGFLKVAGRPGSDVRGKLQGIEADRIYTPNDLPDDYDREDFVNGVRTSPFGATLSYCLCDRTTSGDMKFARIVPANNLILHGFFDRFDQTRGISPIVAALNSLQDVYEGFDYALAKMKVAQLFGLAVYRSDSDRLGDESDTDGDGIDDTVAFGRGTIQLDLDAEDRAEILEAKTPAAETTDFLKLMIHVSLRALDIPYSFFDESFTNFYGSRGGLIQYLKSCKSKQQDLQEVLDEITKWRLGLFVADGELTLPRRMEFDDLRWEWVPDGVPWWDPVKEVTGNTKAIAAGLTDYQRVCRESGTDFFDNIDAIAEQQAYAASKGVVLDLGVSKGGSFDSPKDEKQNDEDQKVNDDEDETSPD